MKTTKVTIGPADAAPMLLRVKRHSPEATMPIRGTPGSAGYDISTSVPKELMPGERFAFDTDLSIEVPTGHYGRLAPRSGLAVKKGVNVMAGVIDSDYRGLLKVVLINHSNETFEVKIGDRIAQLIIERISTPEVEEIEEHEATERGVGGFGSTGMEALATAAPVTKEVAVSVA